jgi:hypothetical protein
MITDIELPNNISDFNYFTITILVLQVIQIFLNNILPKILEVIGKDKNTKNMEEISKKLSHLFQEGANHTFSLINILKQIEQSQKAKLTVDQVDLVVSWYIKSISVDMNNIIHKWYDEYKSKRMTEEQFRTRLAREFENLIKEVDSEFFKLPNVAEAIISKEDKINLLEKINLTFNIVNVLKEMDINEAKTGINHFIDDFTSKWTKR